MGIMEQVGTAQLIWQVMDRTKPTDIKLPAMGRKPAFGDPSPIRQAFPRCTPEEKGLSSRSLAELFRALGEYASPNPHTAMVLRDGAVVSQVSFGPYTPDLWSATYSECKSIVGIAIGMLVDEGSLSLDDTVGQLLGERMAPLSQITQMVKKDITVQQLLTMSSGVAFNESGALMTDDWVRGYLDAGRKCDPGEQFDYNSMNTYMLSAIVHAVSGVGLMDYLQPRLWGPLGIEKIHWECCPKGIEKGGWGFYIRPEDMAKVGQLLLQDGEWNGKRLISHEWATQSTSVQIAANSGSAFDYGYQIWAGRDDRSFLFNGLFGQNLLCYPENRIIVVSTAGNDESFQEGAFFGLCRDLFASALPTGPLPADGEGERILRDTLDSLGDKHPNAAEERHKGFFRRLFASSSAPVPLPEGCRSHAGETYAFEADRCGGMGLLPLVVQSMQNNFTHGLESIGFELQGDTFTLVFKEADETHRIPLGFAAPAVCEEPFHDESYRIAAAARFTTDEDEEEVLVVHLSFLEVADSRIVKVFFRGSDVLVRLSEQPGTAYLKAMLGSFLENMDDGNPLTGAISTVRDSDYVDYKLTAGMQPEAVGHLI